MYVLVYLSKKVVIISAIIIVVTIVVIAIVFIIIVVYSEVYIENQKNAEGGKEWQKDYPEGGRRSSGNSLVLAKKQFAVFARFVDHVPCRKTHGTPVYVSMQ